MKVILSFEKSADIYHMIRRLVIAVFLTLFISFGAWASMVSFYVIETGVAEETEMLQHSVNWENAFLDIFFDAGHIVCNAPILRLDKKPSGDISNMVDMKDARDSGIDFVLIAHIDYETNTRAPKEVICIIYNLVTKEKLLEKKISPEKFKKAKGEYEDIKTFVRGLIPYFGETR